MPRLYTILAIVIIAILAVIADNHMPLASVKIDLTETVSLKILLYDSEDGVLQMTLRNVKTVLSMYNGVQ